MNSSSKRLIIFVVAVILLALIMPHECGSAKHDLVREVPLDSELSKLDQYLHRGKGSSGDVIQWIPLKDGENHTKDTIKNELGTFTPKALGPYDEWKASAEERNKFTGEIIFYHYAITSSDVNSFIYVNGTLRKKDWGYLPG